MRPDLARPARGDAARGASGIAWPARCELERLAVACIAQASSIAGPR